MYLSKLFRVYQNTVHNQPYIVQSVQTALLMTSGDIISQSVIEKKSFSQINFYRTIKFGSIGLVLGPVLTKWYRTVDKIVNSSTKIASIKKVALDQCLFAPCAIAVITAVMSLTEGRNVEETKDILQKDYLHILSSNYKCKDNEDIACKKVEGIFPTRHWQLLASSKVWPVVQFINFSFVPLDYRVLLTQSVAVGWNTYLSWKLNSDK